MKRGELVNVENLCELDFLIFSSHKTATQTLFGTMGKNGLMARHLHTLKNNEVSIRRFLQQVEERSNYNKFKIVSVVRNPKDRLLSSFFHSFNDDEMFFLKISLEETTVSVSTNEELCQLYEQLIKEETLPGRIESIDELSSIFGIDIINMLKKRDDHYYLDYDLFELYVMDFNRLTSSGYLDYLNRVLNIELLNEYSSNLSINKSYYNKYMDVKKMIGNKLDKIIESQFSSFYFTAFL